MVVTEHAVGSGVPFNRVFNYINCGFYNLTTEATEVRVQSVKCKDLYIESR